MTITLGLPKAGLLTTELARHGDIWSPTSASPPKRCAAVGVDVPRDLFATGELSRCDPRGRLGPRRIAARPPAVARPAGRAQLRVHLPRAHRPRTAPQGGAADAADAGADSGGASTARLADARLRRADAPRQTARSPCSPPATCSARRSCTSSTTARPSCTPATSSCASARPRARRTCPAGRRADRRDHLRAAALSVRRPGRDRRGRSRSGAAARWTAASRRCCCATRSARPKR